MIHWRKRKRAHMMMWAMLTQKIDPAVSWLYLLEWAVLGGHPNEVRIGEQHAQD